MPADMGDIRLLTLEHSLYEMHARLMRTEESNTALSAKCQALNDSMVKCLQVITSTVDGVPALILFTVESRYVTVHGHHDPRLRESRAP